MLTHEDIHNFIKELEEESNGQVLTSPRGGKCIGTLADGTIHPYNSIFYYPMNKKYIPKIENYHKRSIPKDYLKFLLIHNGGFLFSKTLSMFGYRYEGDIVGSPIDFKYGDIYSRPSSVPHDWFAIGAFPFSYEENALLMMEASGKIHSLVGERIIEDWPDLIDCLNTLKQRFNDNYKCGLQ